MNAIEKPRVYRTEEAANLLGIPVKSMRDRVRRGQIPYSRLGRTVLIPASFIDGLASPQVPAKTGKGER